MRNFLASVKETAADLDNLEVLIGMDNDDVSFLRLDRLEVKEYSFAKITVFQRRPDLTSYYNDLAIRSRGRFIWVLNDDCVLTTKGWDRLALVHILKTASMGGTFYGRTHDTLGAKNPAGEPTFSMFPLLSRGAYNAQCWVLNPKFPAWGADENLHRIWDGLGRVVDLPMMTVEHRSFHHGLRERDQLSERVGTLSKHPYPSREAMEEDITKEIERIRRVLDGLPSLPPAESTR